MFGLSLAAGPFVVPVLDLLLFCFLFFELRDDELDDEGSGPVAAADGAARDGVGDRGGAPPPPPPPAPPGLAEVDVAAEADDDGGTEEEDDDAPRSRLHSSLWPARHAARWQAWLQYFRCRHPAHFCSGWSVAGAPQYAHSSAMCVKSVRGDESTLNIESGSVGNRVTLR